MFGVYARYYDLIYRDKDYRGEADYVRGLIERFAPESKTVLELGCGTAGHAEHLIRAGYDIHGVDISDDMLKLAEERRMKLGSSFCSRLTLSRDDVRSVRLDRKFDVVISLFHVMSYQTTNEDLLAAFSTAHKHLKEGGVFIFDCWFGPAVLTDPPKVRIKRWEDEEIRVLRIAEPVIHPNDNVVDVNYQILVEEITGDNTAEIKETHQMRYLFKPELELMLSMAGFRLEDCFEFLSNRAPGLRSWNACFVARA